MYDVKNKQTKKQKQKQKKKPIYIPQSSENVFPIGLNSVFVSLLLLVEFIFTEFFSTATNS